MDFGGSSPPAPTKNCQGSSVVERHLGKMEVEGSILSPGSSMKKFYLLIFIIIGILIIGGVYYLIQDCEIFGPETESPSIIEDRITREEIMKDCETKIAGLSPVKPVLGGNWYINRFWFIKESDKDFYIEYEDGHIMRRILIEADKKNGKLDYEVVAYFEPGENDWVLKRGEDKFSGSLLDLYEHSEELNQWIKKN